ncbi:MAG: DUF4147 domain-containing protein, partial [Candidatus Methylomirabilis sp.]
MKVAALRESASEVYRASLQAVDPALAVRRHLVREGGHLLVDGASYPMDSIERILLVGAGKASGAMAEAVEGFVGDLIADGLVMVTYGQSFSTRRVRLQAAGHPVPDDAGLRGAEAILSLLSSAGERDLVIALISGGGSALLPLPVAGVRLADKQELTRQLLACGATI